MLVNNAGEVTEPYTFEFINSLTERPDTITRADDINLNNTLSSHLATYVKNQLLSGVSEKHADEVEIVAEDEHYENTINELKLEEQHNSNGVVTTVPSLGKTKKDKERALVNGDLYEYLITQQNIQLSKISKKKTSKKFKAKVWREWHQDFLRESDAD